MRIRIFPTNYKIAIIRTSAVIVLLIIIRLFFIQWFRAFGMSMEPTVHDGSIVLVNKIAYKFHQIRRGDIVIFRTSNKPYVYFIKRVLAFPGEKVEFKNGVLFINDVEVPEPYLKERGNWNTEPFIVKENHFFVCGDNRIMPWDDHFHPQISMKNILGSAIGYR
ncbi:MAG TPA: signal peptidase I [Candidatus Ratteibacteria bacterium]|jgi:signal peptidase I|uniref:Signal peptidase I n=1 Tax=candidate division TA06 bacterium ADurb.Bin131 TaxID=1852827 RepID=A0A1V6C8H4_UNCT6|nr:MAG: Signal peptidase I V [candidate division TA06 bacterium ADurb.Bin131]HON05151.1 signal peptidase I [bacterium]HRS06850.1 signal peptidase I [Candidatus Ratteibacteria bacterium]OQB75225.1 MAG: Signal peptidase I V [candidate division TA06 bacterium ADurb.Bin131]HQL64480.1 signal peptidase I [bacterium]